MPFPLFYERLISSSRALLAGDGSMSNAEFFSNAFSRGFEDKKAELWKRFMDFYRTEFDQFRRLVTVPEGVRELMERLRKRTCKLVIASNPLWPMDVQIQRLRWARIEGCTYALITAIENMSFCKPRIEYYREICKKIRERPEDCLMVGNDPVNDMVVSQIGMRTYFVEDKRNTSANGLSLSRELRKGLQTVVQEPDFTGPLDGVVAVVDMLRNKSQ